MKTEFWLFGQFESATLTLEQICRLTDKRPQTIRNRVSAGKFPRPTSDGVWMIQDVAAYLDSTKAAPEPLKVA